MVLNFAKCILSSLPDLKPGHPAKYCAAAVHIAIRYSLGARRRRDAVKLRLGYTNLRI